MTAEVVPCGALPEGTLEDLLAPYGLTVARVADGEPIPGSYWGETEAGLVGAKLLVTASTPVHSALHEACHYVCMDPARRADLHTDAGGGDDEENAVCYLSILLAERIPGFGAARMLADMDTWGYGFRLGSARAWFENDAQEVREWLEHEDLIDRERHPTFKLRATPERRSCSPC